MNQQMDFQPIIFVLVLSNNKNIRLGELIVSRIELTRRACHAMSTQSFTSHSLKRLKLLAILGSVLILWGGFLSSAQAEWKSGL